jgi:integrase
MIGAGEPEEYVVTMPAQTITKKLKRYVERSCGKAVTFHELRHINASVMHMLGVPDKYAMERGGWSTDGVLKSVYQHTFDTKRREIDRQINDYFTGLLK